MKATRDTCDEEKETGLCQTSSLSERKRCFLTHILQQYVPRHIHIKQPFGKHLDEEYIVATIKHPPRQMIWGAMPCRGAAGLYFISPNTIMNRPKYVELVK